MSSVRERLLNGETLYWRTLTVEEKYEVYTLALECNPFCPDFARFARYMEWIAATRRP